MRYVLLLLLCLASPARAAVEYYNFGLFDPGPYSSCAAVAAWASGHFGQPYTCNHEPYPGGPPSGICPQSDPTACARVGYSIRTVECVLPQVEENGLCVTPPPPDCKSGRIIGSGYLSYGDSGSSTWCSNGCRVRPEQFIVNGDGSAYANGNHHQTGEACTSAEASENPAPQPDPSLPPNAPSCQPGHYYGQINGATVCVPGASTTTSGPPKTVETTKPDGSGTVTTTGTIKTTGTTPNGTSTTTTTQTTLEQQWSAARQITNQSETSFPSSAIPSTAGETKTSTVTNSDGSKTEYTLTKNADGTVSGTARDQNTVEKTESTTCTGSSCTVTSTTNTNGQPTGSTTGTTDKAGLCKESPDNAQCGDGGGMFAGTCAAGFNCDGDAVQCAMAKKQHEAVCALMENKSAESELYDAEKGKSGNVTGDNPNNSTQAIGPGMFDYTSALGAGSCIPDKSVTVMGSTITLPFSSICPWLAVLGNILVAVSSLAAVRILTRG